MGHQIIASILEDRFEAIAEKIEKVDGLLEWAQIDLADGVFAPNTTWPFVGGDIRELEQLSTSMSLELHLMVADPMKLVPVITQLPVKRVLFQVESFTDLSELREALMVISSTDGMEAGVSLLMKTPVDAVRPLLDVVSIVQLMSIREIGVQGNPFDEETYARVRELRELLGDGMIGIDGGVSLQNAAKLVEAGADNLAVGSDLFGHPGGTKEAVAAFKSLLA